MTIKSSGGNSSLKTDWISFELTRVGIFCRMLESTIIRKKHQRQPNEGYEVNKKQLVHKPVH